MMATAVKLFEDYQCEKPVPVFVWLMFARDTSLDPRSFFENHLNPVGDSGGLEQVSTKTCVRRLQTTQFSFVSLDK